jgi:hypothetical protein
MNIKMGGYLAFFFILIKLFGLAACTRNKTAIADNLSPANSKPKNSVSKQ